MSIKAAIEDFAARLQSLIESQAVERARAAVLNAFGIGAPRKRGRPPKIASAALPAIGALEEARKPRKPRKKAPLQLCPVPGCKNAAAPVFGMVCSKHKDLPKAKIKAFRDARKAKKLKAAGKPAPKALKTSSARKPGRPAKKKAAHVAKTVTKTRGARAVKANGQDKGARPVPASVVSLVPPEATASA